MISAEKYLIKNKPAILGELIKGLIVKNFKHLLDQEYCNCPKCQKTLKLRGKPKRSIETLPGNFDLNRPYFYCQECCYGFYPLDDALSLADTAKQYDVQNLEAWLASEMPFDTASEAYERSTGQKASEHHMHDTANAIGEHLDILEVCPGKEEIENKVQVLSEGKFRRPIIMIGIDGAHGPMRPEPSPHPRKGKRGKGEWKEIKGFRIYLIDSKKIIHLISWHQVCSDKELAENLLIIKNTLIPESKVRIAIIGDGAPWIWNRTQEIFPSAKQILDYYHCSEYVHDAANAHYGKSTREAKEWSEATLTRIYYDYLPDVINGLHKMKPKTNEAEEKISKLDNYLSNHGDKMNYGEAKRAGYHIGSGGIESSNKFISNTRLKRSGAWWYIENANNILKLRCAKHNGTYDEVIKNFMVKDQERIKKGFSKILKRIK